LSEPCCESRSSASISVVPNCNGKCVIDLGKPSTARKHLEPRCRNDPRLPRSALQLLGSAARISLQTWSKTSK
jgi:hypothetical protein